MVFPAESATKNLEKNVEPLLDSRNCEQPNFLERITTCLYSNTHVTKLKRLWKILFKLDFSPYTYSHV